MGKLATVINQPFMPWQQLVADVAGEIEPSTGLPAYREVRVTVPRQSGKTTLILVAEVDRCIAWGPDQRVLYAAQDRQSSRAKWEEQYKLLNRTKLRDIVRLRKRSGEERMEFPRTDSMVAITASGESAGHGQTLDLGVIDEAFAQKDERLVQGFRPAMLTRPAAQMWIVSTMGAEDSIFLHDRIDDGRARVEADERSGVAFFEWSAYDDDDPDDPATWWRCMPALGRTVTESVIQTDHDALPPEEFARAYLNRRTSSGAAVMDLGSWQRGREPTSQVAGLPCFALDVTPNRSHASIAVAGWRPDGRVHVEVVEHRPGTDWIVERMAELERRWHPWPVIVDPGSPAASLLVDLAALGVQTETLDARSYAAACAQFYDAVMGPEPRIVHLDQPVLNLAVGNARKRVLGDAWAWARKVGADVSPLVAVTLARWGLVKAGHGEPQVL
jgi:phage terminase large subunit-like protein